MTLCGHSFCRESAQALVLSAVRCVMLKLSEVPSQMSFDPAKSVASCLGTLPRRSMPQSQPCHSTSLDGRCIQTPLQLTTPWHHVLHCKGPSPFLCRSNDLPLLCPVCKAGANPPCVRCSLHKAAAGGGPAVQWCCRLDPDMVHLLDGNEMEEYLRKSLQVGRLVM